MHRIAASLTVLAVVSVLMIPLSAAGQSLEPQGSVRTEAPSRQKNPYSGLFASPDQQKLDQQKPDEQKPDEQRRVPPVLSIVPRRGVLAPPRVVCGMTVIPVNPDLDSKMLLEPKGDDVDYKVRSLTSPMCR